MDSGAVLADRWVLGERIGSSATARVFLATDRRLRIRVAVKVLSESLATDTRFLGQFEAEARAVSGLEHDHIVRFFDSGTHEVDGVAVPYLVTAWMPGGSLASMFAAGSRLEVAHAASVGAQAASALAHAHAAGLVHRDIKPSNLLFDDQARVHLADFGITRAIAAASVTEPLGSISGTTRYASPEQLQARPVDGRSDVYSLALVLMESVTGVVPRLGDSPAATLALRTGRDVDVSVDFGPLREPLLGASTVDPTRRWRAAELAPAGTCRRSAGRHRRGRRRGRLVVLPAGPRPRGAGMDRQ